MIVKRFLKYIEGPERYFIPIVDVNLDIDKSRYLYDNKVFFLK